MNILNTLYTMRKRIKDKDLIRMKEIIMKEIARRTSADDINTYKGVK